MLVIIKIKMDKKAYLILLIMRYTKTKQKIEIRVLMRKDKNEKLQT
jgi:hypothetical protein